MWLMNLTDIGPASLSPLQRVPILERLPRALQCLLYHVHQYASPCRPLNGPVKNIKVIFHAGYMAGIEMAIVTNDWRSLR